MQQKKNNLYADRGEGLSLYLNHTLAHGHSLTFKRISADELIDLVLKAQSGDSKARDEVVRQLVRYVQKRIIAFKGNKGGFEEDDLYQAGMMGVLTAIDKYNPTVITETTGKRASFLTYATFWIDQQIRRQIEGNSTLIAVPIHIYQIWRNTSKVYYRKCQELGKSIHEMDIANFKFVPVEEIAKELGQTPENVKNAVFYFASRVFSSMDQPMIQRNGDETEVTYGDFVIDELNNEQKTLNSISLEEDVTRLTTIMKTLPMRDRFVVIKRFGIGDDNSLTLDEVGSMLGVTRERVRQIENIAIRIIKGKLLTYKDFSLADMEIDCFKRMFLDEKLGKRLSKPFVIPETAYPLDPLQEEILLDPNGQVERVRAQLEIENKSTPVAVLEPISKEKIQEKIIKKRETPTDRFKKLVRLFGAKSFPDWFNPNKLRDGHTRARLPESELTPEELLVRGLYQKRKSKYLPQPETENV